MVFKGKQIIVGTMVLIIGVAGYLNWSYDAGDNVSVAQTDEEYMPIGKSQAVFSQGAETVTVSADDAKKVEGDNKTQTDNVNKETKISIAKIKLNRDSKRSEAIELIKSTLLKNDTNQELKVEAQQKILEIADQMDKEQSIESMILAKGLSDCAVYITDSVINVITDISDLSESQTAQIREIVYNFTENNNIKIVELNQ